MSVSTVNRPLEKIEEKKPEVADRLVIFAWSGELDKLWPTMILATTGAAMGKETTVFFTFWGLFPLVKNQVRITGENWMQKMLSLMTMDLLGLKPEDLIEGLEPPAGATKALADAQGAITLFI